MNAKQFLTRLQSLPPKELAAIKGVGPILANNISSFVQSPRFEKLIQGFGALEEQQKGVTIISSNQKTGAQSKGIKVCITGSFSQSRDEIKTLLEEQGIKTVDSVTKSTNFVLAGENPGSKLSKAQDLEIPVITNLDELLRLVNENSSED